MKKLVAVLVFVMLCKASLAQTLTSVSPDSTYRGATLSALILSAESPRNFAAAPNGLAEPISCAASIFGRYSIF